VNRYAASAKGVLGTAGDTGQIRSADCTRCWSWAVCPQKDTLTMSYLRFAKSARNRLGAGRGIADYIFCIVLCEALVKWIRTPEASIYGRADTSD